MTDALTEIGQAALKYAENGYSVFPLLDGDKAPATTHGFKDATTDAAKIREWWERNPTRNIGICCEGLTVIDLDVNKGTDPEAWLSAWQQKNGALPETADVRTAHGGRHIYFRDARGTASPSANQELHIDIRTNGAYVVAPPSVLDDGGRYEWLHGLECIADADDTVYRLIDAVKPKPGSKKARTKKVAKGGKIREGERNETLFQIAMEHRDARDLDAEGLNELLQNKNAELCEPPLPAAEVKRIAESAAKRPGKPASHNVLAQRLAEERHFRFIQGMPCVWQGGGDHLDGEFRFPYDGYEPGWDAVEQEMILMQRDCTQGKRREVRAWLELMAPRIDAAPPNLVAFENGVLDLETMELMPHDPEIAIPITVPHAWNDAAECAQVDAVISDWACGDPKIAAQIGEMFGLCLWRGGEFARMPVLLGRGANGKSACLALLEHSLGHEYVSHIEAQDFGERFQSLGLLGKLANIGDDLPPKIITGEDASIIKKCVTCEPIHAEVKGGRLFSFTPTATLVFAANTFPRLGDSSFGMVRRLWVLPFRADFSEASGRGVAGVARALATEEAAQRALAIGARAIHDALARGYSLTETETATDIVNELRAESSSTFAFAAETYGVDDASGFPQGKAVSDVYSEYERFCEMTRAQPVGMNRFSREFKELYPGAVSKKARVAGYDGVHAAFFIN